MFYDMYARPQTILHRKTSRVPDGNQNRKFLITSEILPPLCDNSDGDRRLHLCTGSVTICVYTAQCLEHLTGDQQVTGSISARDSEIFSE